MKSAESNAALDRSAASDLWRNTLFQIPSVFGRLVYISSLRNPNNGCYEHHGLGLIFGEGEANKALKKSHKQLFAEWLTFNLEQQKSDLERYFSGLKDERKALLQTWVKLAPFRSMIPSSARRVERSLFVSDLNVLLALLKNASDAAAPDQVA